MNTRIKCETAWHRELGAHFGISPESNRGTRLLAHFLFLCIFALLASTSAHAQSFAYVANNSSNNVSVINTATNTVAATVPVGSLPGGIAVTPDGSFVYVTNYGDNTVSVINTTTNTVVATVGVGNGPQGIGITPNGALAYVANSTDNTVSVISTASNTVVATPSVAAGGDTGPVGVTFSPDGQFAYVVSSQSVSVLSTASYALAATVSVPAGNGSSDNAGTMSPNGTNLYVPLGYGNIGVVSTASNQNVATFSLTGSPGGTRGAALAYIAISPDGTTGYGTLGGFSEVVVFSTATNQVTTTVQAGPGLQGIALTPNGRYAYVAGYDQALVYVIDTVADVVVTTVPVGTSPYQIAITPPACIVTDNSDDPTDSGSLRYCVDNAVAGGVINFAPSLNGQTITLNPANGPLTINTNTTVTGPGASNLAISGNNSVGVFAISGGATVTISGVTIENGAANYGGGVYNQGTLTLTDSTLSNNSSANTGGGIENGGGTLTVTNSTLSGNSSEEGGGIYNFGTLTVTNSTFSGNSTPNTGGGINNYAGPLTVTNSTFSGNSAYTGGGIGNQYDTMATVTNSTFSGNSAPHGADFFNSSGTVTVKNSTLANSLSGENCFNENVFVSQGYNLSDDGSCGFTQSTDLNSTPAGLDPRGLQNNGGPTQTILPLPGSAAICGGSSTLVGSGVTTDQRGLPRLNTSYPGTSATNPCLDVGAVQTNYQSIQFTNVPETGNYSGIPGQAVTPAPVVSVTESNQLVGDIPITLSFSGAGTASGLGPVTTVAATGATFSSLSATAAGNDSISATLLIESFSGTPFALSASANLNISGFSTSTTISAPSTIFGLPESITVTVSSAQETPTGNVVLTVDNGTPLTGQLSNGSAIFSFLPGTNLELSGGTHSLSASYAAQGAFAASSASGNLQVSPANPQVTFSTPESAPYGNLVYLSAQSSNPETNGYISATGPCALGTMTQGAGFVLATITITAPSGQCGVAATFPANNNYLAGIQAQWIQATKATPLITWPTPAAITYGTALGATQLNATATYNGSTVAGSFVYSPAKGTVLGAGSQSLSVIFTPNNKTDFTDASAFVFLQVNQATPKITWTKPAAIVYGTTLSNTQLNATASVPGTFSYSPAAGAVLTAGTQTLSVTFTPTDNVDYTTTTDSANITVQQATPVLAWPVPAPIVYGTPLSSTQLDSTASVPGTFAYSPALGAIEPGGTDKLSATFTPADTIDYTNATASVSLQVTGATPAISWPTPAPITYGTVLSGTQLDATATYNGSTVGGTYTYTPTKGTVLGAGSQPLSVTFVPNNTSNYVSAGASVALQVNQATPKITWAKPAAIIYGNALSSTQLDATASVPGTFVYSPAQGVVLTGGTQTLSATFTPTDSVDYATASDSVSLTVNQASTATTIASVTPTSPEIGQSVTVNFTVAGSNAGPQAASPTGTVTATDSSGPSCIATLPESSCTITLNAKHSTVTANYSGDVNYKASTSKAFGMSAIP